MFNILIQKLVSFILSILTFVDSKIEDAINVGNVLKEGIKNPAVDFVTDILGKKIEWDNKIVDVIRENIDEVIGIFSYLSIDIDKILAKKTTKDKFFAFFKSLQEAEFGGETIGEIISKLVGFAIDKLDESIVVENEGIEATQTLFKYEKQPEGFWTSPIGQAIIKVKYDQDHA